MARGLRRHKDSELDKRKRRRRDEEEFESQRKKQREMKVRHFFEIEADEDSSYEEENDDDDEEMVDGFIIDTEVEAPKEEIGRKPCRPPFLMIEDEDDVELERQIYERYGKSNDVEYDEEVNEVAQQALLPSLKDSKLWRVKCAIGHERETAIRLMQKSVDSPELQIRSVISLDHLKNYIYVEADKLAHVKEACKGLRNIFSYAEVMLVPMKEMTDVLSVKSNNVDLSRNTWVRLERGTYKGDLARVVDVDNVRRKVTVMLIPRIDLQNLADKLEFKGIGTQKKFPPAPRFFSSDEARDIHISVREWRDKYSGEHFEIAMDMKFKDGFLYKTVSMKSVSSENIQPTFDELEKFRKSDDVVKGDMLRVDRKKGHFKKGDTVTVVQGDLKNLIGWVEKVEEENVHIISKMEGLPKTLAFNEKELRKYFKPGNHVKVVSGIQEGATGMVVKVEGHILIISSDTTKEHIRVFADNVVESSDVSTGIARLGDYELHDLVLLDNMSFGVIIQVESNVFQVFNWNRERPKVMLVKLSEIKSKIRRQARAQDHFKNLVSTKDIVRVLEGPCTGRQGPVEHIYREILFIFDRHQQEHGGFICVKAQSCMVVGGSHGNREKSVLSSFSCSGFASLRYPVLQPPGRPLKGPPITTAGRYKDGSPHSPLIGKSIKIRYGPWKGYRGRVKEITGLLMRVELESQMKIVTVNKNDISEEARPATSFCDTPLSCMGSETQMHPSWTPLRPCQTPMRDSTANALSG